MLIVDWARILQRVTQKRNWRLLNAGFYLLHIQAWTIGAIS